MEVQDSNPAYESNETTKEEGEDQNLDYGTYYDTDGERRQDVMEVQDSNPAYECNETTKNENEKNKNSQSNSVDQLDDYDYIGDHDDPRSKGVNDYDYMGNHDDY